MDTLTLIEQEALQTEEADLTQEGFEVSIEDLLESSLSKEHSERNEFEAKLQEVYKHTPFYLNLQNKIRSAHLLGLLVESGDAVVCEKCGQIYRIGEWPLCGAGMGREHGRVRVRNAQSNICLLYYINRQTGKVWIPGKNNRHPIDNKGRAIP